MRADRTPKPPSEKQLEANRRNATKSTGPRTAAGRARSRMNALRHGLCARVVLLPGEDRSEYGVFAKDFCDELKPKGIVQQMLAGRVAALAWALSRLPRAVRHLVERGENQRWHHWFAARGLKDLVWMRKHYNSSIDRDPPAEHAEEYARAGFHENDDQFIDRELERAYADGDPPPERHKPPGVIADAIAGQHGFEAVLKLDEYERRLWSALQSALRSLERRQKLDGCAEDDEAPDERDSAEVEEEAGQPSRGAGVSPASSHTTESAGGTPSPRDTPAQRRCDPPVQDSDAAGAPPLAVSQTEARDRSAHRSAKPPSGDRAGAADPARSDLSESATPPARNEPNSDDESFARGEPETSHNPQIAQSQRSCGTASDSHTAGAERTHLTDGPRSPSHHATDPDPEPPPPN